MKLHHIAITVKDLGISLNFYGGLFGFKEISRFRREDMRATGCMAQNENIVIEFWQFDEVREGIREDLPLTGIKHLAFTDDNPEAVRELFVGKGIDCGQLKTGASGGIYFFFTDPDLNQIEIYNPPANL